MKGFSISVWLFCLPLFSSIGGRTQALSSEWKTDPDGLQIGCLSYQLTSWRKSALDQKPFMQIPKAFHQHEIAEKTKMI